MLDGKRVSGDQSGETTIDCLEAVQDRIEFQCLKVARVCKIEDLVLATFVSEQNSLVDLGDVTTMKLRKEMQQLLRLTRGCALYFSVLTLVYLFQTLVCYLNISPEEFSGYWSDQDYAMEVYGFVESVCIMNIIHALTLISLAAFVVLLTRKFKILDEKHYWQLVILTAAILLVYFIPVVITCYRAYADNDQSEQNSRRGAVARFFDMFFYVLMKTEMGVGGFFLAVIIHFQLYLMVFVMLWCASHVKELIEKMQKLKEANAGTYQGLELKGVEDTLETTPAMTDAGLEFSQGITLAEDQRIEPEQKEGDLLN